MAHRHGRPTRLTPAIQDALCQAVRTGLSLNEAAVLVGLDPTTARQWVARGEGRHPTRPTIRRFPARALVGLLSPHLRVCRRQRSRSSARASHEVYDHPRVTRCQHAALLHGEGKTQRLLRIRSVSGDVV